MENDRYDQGDREHNIIELTECCHFWAAIAEDSNTQTNQKRIKHTTDTPADTQRSLPFDRKLNRRKIQYSSLLLNYNIFGRN